MVISFVANFMDQLVAWSAHFECRLILIDRSSTI